MRLLAVALFLMLVSVASARAEAAPSAPGAKPAIDVVGRIDAALDDPRSRRARTEVLELSTRAPGRIGRSVAPKLLRLRNHLERDVRIWARRALKAMKFVEPKLVLQQDDPALVAQLIDAYAAQPDPSALHAIIQLAHSDRIQVRNAARAAVNRYGKNAVWKLREAYEEATSQRAKRAWNWKQTAQEYYLVLDRTRIEHAETRLAKGMQAYLDGDLATMRGHYDALLAREPEFAEREKMAEGYAALGQQHLQKDELGPARDAYGRALRLAPNASTAQLWRAQRDFLDAERALAAGVVDLAGYDRAISFDAAHAGALEAVDRITGARQARARERKRLAASGAIGLLIMLAGLMLNFRKEDEQPEKEDSFTTSSGQTPAPV